MGIKPTTVVITDVITAAATSPVARGTISTRAASRGASSSRFAMFSVNTIPMSTIVPIAMAIPDSAITLASTPTYFIATNVARTPSGKSTEISSEVRKCRMMSSTTMTVISTC